MPEQYGATGANVSVILTTHNGADKLRRTLPAVFEAVQCVQGTEFIVVNNASTDDTVNVIRNLSKHNQGANLKVETEQRKGKSYGLNRGLASATGDLLVFIDDDVRPEKNWLISFCEAAVRFPSRYAFFGQIRPDWPVEPPDWLRYLTEMGQSYGCTPLNRPEGPCDYGQAKGANFMVRRAALDRGVRFDEGHHNYGAIDGRSGHGGEDVKFVYDVLQDTDNELIFVPDAIVFHAITLEEMSFVSVLKRYRGIGQSRAAQLHAIGRTAEIARPGKILATTLKVALYAALLNRSRAAVYSVRLARLYGEWMGDTCPRGRKP